METFLAHLWITTVSMSAVAAVMAAVFPLLASRYSPKCLFYAWLVAALGFLIPVRPRLDLALLPLAFPADFLSENTASTLYPVIFGVWLAGCVIFLVVCAAKYSRFVKMVRRWSADVTDTQTLDVFHNVKREMKIRRPVALKTCAGVTSPMMFGFFSPTVLLPETEITAQELHFVFRHELTHFRRGDLWWRAAVMLALALHWFNPVVYLIARRVKAYGEISCDAAVLRSAPAADRQRYAETIIRLMRGGRRVTVPENPVRPGGSMPLANRFHSRKAELKTRIFSIMDTTQRRAGRVMLAGVAAVTLLTGTLFMHPAQESGSVPQGRMVAQAEIPKNPTPEPVFEPVFETAVAESHENATENRVFVKNEHAVHVQTLENQSEMAETVTETVEIYEETVEESFISEETAEETFIVIRRELPAEEPPVVIDIPAKRSWGEVFSPGQMVEVRPGQTLLTEAEVRELVFAAVPEDSGGVVIFKTQVTQDYEQLVYEGMLYKNGVIHEFILDAFSGEIYAWHEREPGQ